MWDIKSLRSWFISTLRFSWVTDWSISTLQQIARACQDLTLLVTHSIDKVIVLLWIHYNIWGSCFSFKFLWIIMSLQLPSFLTVVVCKVYHIVTNTSTASNFLNFLLLTIFTIFFIRLIVHVLPPQQISILRLKSIMEDNNFWERTYLRFSKLLYFLSLSFERNSESIDAKSDPNLSWFLRKCVVFGSPST